MKVLITSGATRESIDSIRFITNFSTGKTGSTIADFFALKNCQVFLLCGMSSVKPKNKKIKIFEFKDFKDLNGKLERLLKIYNFDLIIHLAAVSDYSVDYVILHGKKIKPEKLNKIDSQENDSIMIKLKRNFKIIERLRNYCLNSPVIIGFKLTHSSSQNKMLKEVHKLNNFCDFVVHNDVKEIGRGHPFHVYANGKNILNARNEKELAKICYRLIAKRETPNTSGV